MTTASALTKPAQIRITRRTPAYWRVTFDNPPLNVMGPGMVKEFHRKSSTLSKPTSMSESWSSTAPWTTTS